MLELKLANRSLTYSQPLNVDITFPSKQYAFASGSNKFVSIAGYASGRNWNGNVSFPNGADRVKVFSEQFNGDVYIPKSVTNLADAFSGCRQFNRDVEIYNGVVNCDTMFSSAFAFNRPITLPNTVVDCGNMFFSHCGFNQDITIPAGVTDVYQMFNTEHFNSNVVVQNGVSNLFGLFYGANTYDKPFVIPESARLCTALFALCKQYNQPTEIPNGVTSCGSMFSGCWMFNQPVNIPNSVTDCSKMFANSRVLNQTVQIPNSVANCTLMFANSQDITVRAEIPDSVSRNYLASNGMFFNANNCKYDIVCHNHYNNSSQDANTSKRRGSLCGVLFGWNATVGATSRANIHTTQQNISMMKEVNFVGNGTGDLPYTWSDMDGGVYNSTYNIYLYGDL